MSSNLIKIFLELETLVNLYDVFVDTKFLEVEDSEIDIQMLSLTDSENSKS